MRFLKSLEFNLSQAYDYTDIIDMLSVPDNAVISIETETFHTPYIKLPFTGGIATIQRYQEYTPKNVNIRISGKQLYVYHDYPQAAKLNLNVYGDDTFKYESEMLPIVVDMRDITAVYISGTWLTVSTLTSGYNVRVHYPGTNYGDRFYPTKIRSVQQEYYTQNLTFTANKDTQGRILSYDATTALFATQYV